MSEGNGNGNGARRNPLDQLFGDEKIRVKVLSAQGEETGIVGVFHTIAPQHKTRYDQIVQKGFGGRKPKYDEGDFYAFPKVIEEIEGLTKEDCGDVEPVQFLQRDPKGQQLLKLLMSGFWNQTLPSTEEDSAKK